MKSTLFLIVLSIALAACGGSRSDVTQKADKGYLKFVGNPAGTSFTVDDGPRVVYDPKIELYEVRPTSHDVKGYRNDAVIVTRTILVDNENIFEIEVP